MRLIFACPSYGPLDPQAVVSQRCAIMHAAEHGHQWIGDCSPDKLAWSVTRNKIVTHALETEADAICWADSDVILPPYAYTELLRRGDDFVTGIYVQRHTPHFPLIAHFNPTGGKDGLGTFQWCIQWPTNVIAPIDGCGFGVVVTSTKMLRAMAEDDPGGERWFRYEKFSEDFDFCLRAKRAGYQLFVHTGVLCGHLMDPVAATQDHFAQWQATQDGATSAVA